MGIAVSPQIHPQVAEFLGKPRTMLINGQWVKSISGKNFPTYNPATGEVLAQVAEGDREDVELAVRAARKAFDQGPWRRLTASERGKLIWKLADLLEQHTEEFAYLESLDNGKPLTVARAGRCAVGGRSVSLHGRLDDEARRQYDSDFRPLHARSEIPRLHAARTRGRGRANHSLELPTADGRMEAGPCARRRLHRGVKASRANAAFRLAYLAS